MIKLTQTRRIFLSRILLTVSSFSLFPGCGFGKNKTQETITKLTALLRHHSIAAHLGQVNVESNSALQSLSLEALASEILINIDLDINKISNSEIDSIAERLDEKIRQDFTDENVVTIDGWLLSQTEAKICALVFRNIQQPES